MKKICKIVATLLALATLLSIPVGASTDRCMHWFIKRRPGKEPTFPPDADNLAEYDAYYIDKAAAEAENKLIYLTFDAGYENGNIEKILDILKSESIPAAFFLLDNIIIKNTDLVIRMADEGHLVCNHTKNHKNLSHADSETIKNDLTALEKIYTDRTGREMAKYFRFPEGSYSVEALKTIQSMGYKTVFWSFAYDDWDNRRQPNEELAIKKVLDGTHPGAVMLFHPTSNTNLKILPTLIKSWKEMGYSFGTLDELTK